MKLKTMVFCLGLASTTSLYSVRASSPAGEQFLGNWTRTFTLRDGSTVEHTPHKIRMGFITASEIDMHASVYNGLPMKAPLVLKTNSSVDEFIAALVASGLMNPPRNVAPPKPHKDKPAPAPAQSAFDAKTYLANYPHVSAEAVKAGKNPETYAQQHFKKYAALIPGLTDKPLAAAAPAFNAKRYLEKYPHVKTEADQAGVNAEAYAEQHYNMYRAAFPDLSDK